MIERLSGKIVVKKPMSLVVECGGVGLQLSISLNTAQDVGQIGDSLNILCYLHIREDAMQLFGFSTEAEREMFLLLIGISGIGPKLAITILSGISTGDLKSAIAVGNDVFLTKIPGVGKKTAQRIVLELKEKIHLQGKPDDDEVSPLSADPSFNKARECIMALIALGYKSAAAENAVGKVLKSTGDNLPVNEIIKLALREI